MRSPIPPHPIMLPVELAPGLQVLRCPASEGHWIPAAAYWRWIAQQPTQPTPTPANADDRKAVEDRGIRICPETGLLMIRFRVGKDLHFHIDRSPNGGIWLDAGEWEALREKGLHDDLHRIFSHPWQREARRQELNETLLESFSQRIGEEDFAKAREFKRWLNTLESKRHILTYLGDEELI